TKHHGGTFRMPFTDRLSMLAKADRRIEEQGLETTAQEINVSYRVGESWRVSTGVRNDERIDRSPIVPVTQVQGERTDAIVQVDYDSDGRWSAYGFVQDTLSISGAREENARAGTGGVYRLSERLSLDAEISGGDLGTGG